MYLMVKFDKEGLRKNLLRKRLGISTSVTSLKSQAIAKQLLAIAKIRNKNNFSAYLPINNEVDTRKIIDELIQKGSNIFVPAFLTTNNDYLFTGFDGWQNLEEGPKGILQPKSFKPIDPSFIEVAILPGLAFSKEGVRLGYGKGVFDKLLSKSKALRIGLAYDFQIVDEIPQEKHDLVMDLVVTEERVIRL